MGLSNASYLSVYDEIGLSLFGFLNTLTGDSNRVAVVSYCYCSSKRNLEQVCNAAKNKAWELVL